MSFENKTKVFVEYLEPVPVRGLADPEPWDVNRYPGIKLDSIVEEFCLALSSQRTVRLVWNWMP